MAKKIPTSRHGYGLSDGCSNPRILLFFIMGLIALEAKRRDIVELLFKSFHQK
ncbi:MAG: hypothetical protein ACFFFC_16970 [Candidatus Thorarchaeota archaeon]